MQSEDLVRMANQIAQFFAVYPEEDAVDGVREHLEKFWPPAMRKELVAIADGLVPHAVDLHPLALKATSLIRNPAAE
jgi:formate dehydrogenase subunit delta